LIMRFLITFALLALLSFTSIARAQDGEASKSRVIDLNSGNFDERVFKDTSKAWFVEFFAPWCGHCKRLAPIWEELAVAVADTINIARMDCTAHADKCRQQEVRGYPTIKLFNHGDVVKYQSGRSLDEFKQFLKQHSVIDPPKIVLRYFETQGRAEIVRLVLEELHLKYEQVLYNSDTWPAAKKELTENGVLPFGQVPSLSIGETHLVQSLAIIRYLGRSFGSLYPAEALMAARIDIVVDGVNDLVGRYGKLVYDPDVANKKEQYVNEVVSQWFGYFENLLSADHPFYLPQLTLADFALFIAVDSHIPLKPDLLESFPKLQRHYSAFSSRPTIAAYLASDRRPARRNGKSAFFDNEPRTATA